MQRNEKRPTETLINSIVMPAKAGIQSIQHGTGATGPSTPANAG